jgi:hypothetical protein
MSGTASCWAAAAVARKLLAPPALLLALPGVEVVEGLAA